MAQHLHRWWTEGYFALRPLKYNTDKSELKVEWYWQPKYDHKGKDLVELEKLPLSSRDLEGYEKCYFGVRSSENSLTQIRSGHTFTFKTSDPDRLRLPSKKLLKLQWHLNRIVSMSAAAEKNEEDDGNDNYSNSDIEQWLSQSSSSALSPAREVSYSEADFDHESDAFRRSFLSTPTHTFAVQTRGCTYNSRVAAALSEPKTITSQTL